MTAIETFDCAVIGGGPAGATAADTLAREGFSVLLLDKAGRIKPCGGAIPPRLVMDFDIPDNVICARITSARMVSPSGRHADMPIDGGYVGMVDRDVFDEFLRKRAAANGAHRRTGQFLSINRDDGAPLVTYRQRRCDGTFIEQCVRARIVIGADGALSAVARQSIPGAERIPFVFAYHEIVKAPETGGRHFKDTRCDVYYDGRYSPDFYSWIFPHGSTVSIGTGSASKGLSLRDAVSALRNEIGFDSIETIRKEGAPIPLKPLSRWDNGADTLVCGDAAGVVAPASGEGIYYAMHSGQLAAEAVAECLRTSNARALSSARRRFMQAHGKVFLVLRVMQHVWYRNDDRRERFVSICRDADVQKLTWQAYMHKRLVRAKPMAHARIFFKDLAHIMGVVPS